jgi:hypothetical protein
MSVRSCFSILFLAVLFTVDTTSAQVANPELETCRSTGLIALRETIIIGDAYLEQGKKDSRRTFLCLIGEKGKVLLTFFTDK